MAEAIISEELLALLRQVDTPTVCNAIEVAQGKRGFNCFTRGTMQPVSYTHLRAHETP